MLHYDTLLFRSSELQLQILYTESLPQEYLYQGLYIQRKAFYTQLYYPRYLLKYLYFIKAYAFNKTFN